MEFLSLRQKENMIVVEYLTRLLMLKRLAQGSFVTNRYQAAQFVSGLRISIRLMVVPFSCSTLAEAIMRALECEHAHKAHHQASSIGQTSHQG